jgi:transketolase
MTQRVLAATEQLKLQGISCGILHCHTIKPLDQQLILDLASSVELVVTVEEHILNGGLGTAVLETLNNGRCSSMPRVVRLGIPSCFVEEYGSQDSVLESFGLSPDLIARSTRDYFGRAT